MQREDGFFSIGKLLRNDFKEVMAWWGDGSCLHAKNAIGMLKLSRSSNQRSFLSHAKKTLNWVLNLQNEDGGFRISRKHNYVFTHAHCYALEGLLYSYLIVEEERYLDATLKGGYWLLMCQNSDGSLYQYYGPDVDDYLSGISSRMRLLRKIIRPRETGATAQAMRIWLALYHQTQDKNFLEAAGRSAKFLLSMQSRKNERNAFGGFYTSCDKFINLTRVSSQLFPWVTMFTCQALIILEDQSRQKFSNFAELLF